MVGVRGREVEVRVRVGGSIKIGGGEGEVWVVNGDGDIKEVDGGGGDSGGEV